MEIFDAHIRSDTRSEDDLKNLAYFETRQVLTASHPVRPFEVADEALAYFESLVTEEATRLRRNGLTPHVALGLLHHGRPRRTHHEVWRDLPFLLAEEVVVAVGEIGAWEDTEEQWELFELQVRLAREHDLALLIVAPADLRVNMTYKMMQRLERLDFPPHLAVLDHLDARLVETVVREGFVAGVSVGPSHMEPREAASLLLEVLDAVGTTERIVLNSALRAGSGDILGIPKAVVTLQERGLDRGSIERLCFGNAMGIFVR